MNLNYLYYNIKSRLVSNKQFASSEKEQLHHYSGREFLTTEQFNHQLTKRIVEGKPFMVARFGTVELSCMKAFEFKLEKTIEGNMFVMQRNAGFFPNKRKGGYAFCN